MFLGACVLWGLVRYLVNKIREGSSPVADDNKTSSASNSRERFSVWIQWQDKDLNLWDALDKYIAEHNIILLTELDESEEITRLRAEVSVLEESINDFDEGTKEQLRDILFRFRSALAMSLATDELRKKQKELDAEITEMEKGQSTTG